MCSWLGRGIGRLQDVLLESLRCWTGLLESLNWSHVGAAFFVSFDDAVKIGI